MDKVDDTIVALAWSITRRVNPNLMPVENPVGILVGGTPGAGKSTLHRLYEKELADNLLVINGDEFRKLHPDYDRLYHEHGKEASKYTAAFAATMVGIIRDKAIESRFNILIEGTFRTSEVPLNEMNNFKKNGYAVDVAVMVCDKEESWKSTLSRAELMEKSGEQPRFVPREHFDTVVANLPDNADKIFQSGLARRFRIFNREGMIYDSSISQSESPGKIINNELHKESKKNFISNLEDVRKEKPNQVIGIKNGPGIKI